MNAQSCRIASLLLIGVVTAPQSANRLHSEQSLPSMRIVLVGDSTVTNDQGWGSGFSLLVTGDVEVVNLAAHGRSSKSFIAEGLWAEALAKQGQYYLIQFGHNDEPGKGPDRETDPKTTFRSNMARYQTPYVEAVRALAIEKQVLLVDLHAISLSDAEHAGNDVWADLSPRDDKGQIDRTHLNAKGSEVVGRMIAEALRRTVPDLAARFRIPPER
jgi:pectinesterase